MIAITKGKVLPSIIPRPPIGSDLSSLRFSGATLDFWLYWSDPTKEEKERIDHKIIKNIGYFSTQNAPIGGLIIGFETSEEKGFIPEFSILCSEPKTMNEWVEESYKTESFLTIFLVNSNNMIVESMRFIELPIPLIKKLRSNIKNFGNIFVNELYNPVASFKEDMGGEIDFQKLWNMSLKFTWKNNTWIDS